jgi:hypothetical protein
VWDLIAARHGGIPPARVAGTDLRRTISIRLDATLVVSHSDKEQATATFKPTWGHYPLTAWCDNTGESLASTSPARVRRYRYPGPSTSDPP